MTRLFVLLTCLVTSLFASLSTSVAALEVAAPFSSHMVLQRDRDIPVWGTHSPDASITVRFAGQSASTTADASGKWQVNFPALPAGGKYTLQVSSCNENIAMQNIIMGDIWICSGQSNMQWSVKNSLSSAAEIAAATFPDIRLLTLPRKTSAEPIDTFDASWTPCSPETIAGFSAVGYFFGREVHGTTGVPIGLISTNWGGTPAEAWTSLETLRSNPDFAPMLERRETFLKQQANRAAMDPPVPMTAQEKKAHRPQNIAGMLYNAMISPLIQVPIRGAIWYQGESNAGRAEQYETLFPAMIENWRAVWNQGDFPFYFVQLANFKERNQQPVDDAWAELRDAQFQTLKLPNTGMAVAIDIGEAKDIHPKNKQDVGKRLALWALAQDYQITEPTGSLGTLPLIGRWFQQPITYSGPLYQGSKTEGSQIVIQFDHTADGLATSDGNAPVGFAIAGEDRQFVWADAVIEGNTVVVSHPKIGAPVAVRYGWSTNPEVNLINSAGLPASPFRTDDWPGITDGKR